MTAAELASFRTLLQAQAPSPPSPDRGLFARMRARLTVVERSEPFYEAAARFRPSMAPRLTVVSQGNAGLHPERPTPLGRTLAPAIVTLCPIGSSSPGSVIGGRRSRPASAQRRVLQRLEAVFTAELEGLDARIAADAPAS